MKPSLGSAIGNFTQNYLDTIHSLLDSNLILSRPENNYSTNIQRNKIGDFEEKLNNFITNYRNSFAEILGDLKELITNRGSRNDLDRVRGKMYEQPFGKFQKFPSKIQSELDDIGELLTSRNMPTRSRNSSYKSRMRKNNSSSNLFNSGRSERSPKRWKNKDFGTDVKRKRDNKALSRVELSPKVQRAQQKNIERNPQFPMNFMNSRRNYNPGNGSNHNFQNSLRNRTPTSRRNRSPIILPQQNPINTSLGRVYKKPEILHVVTPDKNRNNPSPSFANSNRLTPIINTNPIINTPKNLIQTPNPNLSDHIFSSMTPRADPKSSFNTSNQDPSFNHPNQTENNNFQPPPPRFSSAEEEPPVRLVENKKIVEKVELRPISSVEIRDTDIKDKQTYFQNNSSERIDIPESTVTKLDFNSAGSYLFLSGLSGTTTLNTNIPSVQTSKASITTYQGNRSDKKSSTLYIQKENFITQEPNSNDLVLNDKNMNEIKRLGGNYEPGKVLEHFHDYRHSLDTDYMLWRKGDDELAIVDKVLFKTRYTIKKFWIYKNSKSCMPVAACSDRTGSKIMASSMAGPNTHILHFYNENENNLQPDKSTAVLTEQALPKIKRITCMDINSTGDVVYLGGLKLDKSPAIVAVGMNKNFTKIAEYSLTDLEYKKLRRLKRVRGYEIIVIGGRKHFTALDFSNNRFTRLASIPNVHKNEITDFAIRDHVMISKAFNEEGVKVTYLGPRAGSAPIPTAQSYESVFSTDGESVKSTDSSSRGYRESKREKIETGLKDMEKVILSKSGNNLYVGGGVGLTIFARKSGTSQYAKYKSDKEESKFVFLNFF